MSNINKWMWAVQFRILRFNASTLYFHVIVTFEPLPASEYFSGGGPLPSMPVPWAKLPVLPWFPPSPALVHIIPQPRSQKPNKQRNGATVQRHPPWSHLFWCGTWSTHSWRRRPWQRNWDTSNLSKVKDQKDRRGRKLVKACRYSKCGSQRPQQELGSILFTELIKPHFATT